MHLFLSNGVLFFRANLLIICFLVSVTVHAQPLEIGPSLTLVGNPFLTEFPLGGTDSFSRNINDIAVYAGHLWLGNGNTATGAPFDLYALRLADQQFVRMRQNLPQEIIYEFRFFNNRLYVASADEANGGVPNVTVIDGTVVNSVNVVAPSNWSLGAHNDDIYATNNGQTLIFPVATTLTGTPANTLISTNAGASWRFATGMPTGGSGPYRFMDFRGTMYASKLSGSSNYSTDTDFLYKYTPGGANDFMKVYANGQAAGLPNSNPYPYNLFANPYANFAGDLYYTSSNRLWRITQIEPSIVSTEVSLLTPFPFGARVQDLFVHNNQLYVLLNEIIGSGATQRHRANIYRSFDGVNWTALYRFTTVSNNSVKAFARTSNAFYFGYGTSYDAAATTTDQAGNVYRYAVADDGTSGLPNPSPLPVVGPAPTVLDDIDATRLVSFGASGSGTTAAQTDYDTSDADLELKINRTSNSVFTGLVIGSFGRTGPITTLRDSSAVSTRVIGKAGASSAAFSLHWVVNTDAWTSGSGNYRGFNSTSVSATAATNTLFTLNLTSNPSISAAAANYIAGNGTFFQIIIDNNGSPTFAGALEFGLDDFIIGTPLPASPAATTGFTATSDASDSTRINLAWTALNVATTSFLLERSSGGGAYVQVGTYSGLASGATDTGLTPNTVYTYRLRTYLQGYSTPIAATATTPTAIAAWRQIYFNQSTATGNAASIANPDGDALNNLLEYALGSNPTSANSISLPTASLGSDGTLSLTYFRARPELNYIVQGSSNLTAWANLSTNSGVVGQNVTVFDAPSVGSQFLRLSVVDPASP